MGHLYATFLFTVTTYLKSSSWRKEGRRKGEREEKGRNEGRREGRWAYFASDVKVQLVHPVAGGTAAGV